MVGGLGDCHVLVEHGVISDDAFRDMVFTNAIEFWTSEKRDFFNGTAVQAAADSLLANGCWKYAVVGSEPGTRGFEISVF